MFLESDKLGALVIRLHRVAGSENPATAAVTYWVTQGADIVRRYLEETTGGHVGDVSDLRVNSKGILTFRAGCGYDVADANLLGGTGNGDAKRDFEAWVATNYGHHYVSFVFSG